MMQLRLDLAFLNETSAELKYKCPEHNKTRPKLMELKEHHK
jgi:hypothetical protein